jgi:hypothetical protein
MRCFLTPFYAFPYDDSSLFVQSAKSLQLEVWNMDVRTLRRLVSFLLVCILSLTLLTASSSAQRRRRNPQAGKGKAAKRIGVGTAIGAGAGALIGGRKGALIGAGAGAAGGTAYHYHKKRQWRRRHRRY